MSAPTVAPVVGNDQPTSLDVLESPRASIRIRQIGISILATASCAVTNALYGYIDSRVNTVMKITNIRWSEVKVTYSEHVPTDWPEKKKVDGDLYKNSHAIFDGKENSLQIVEYDSTNWSTGRAVILTRPNLVRLDYNSAIFEAYWWSSKMDSAGFDQLIPCRVECTF